MEQKDLESQAQTRFMFDHVVDGAKDQSLLLWQALDTKTNQVVWMIGRKVKPDAVLPLALLQPWPQMTVNRYAPAAPEGGWDFSKILSKGEENFIS